MQPRSGSSPATNWLNASSPPAEAPIPTTWGLLSVLISTSVLSGSGGPVRRAGMTSAQPRLLPEGDHVIVIYIMSISDDRVDILPHRGYADIYSPKRKISLLFNF